MEIKLYLQVQKVHIRIVFIIAGEHFAMLLQLLWAAFLS
jgi:hypothetical protein